jgi:hypothetical protein
MNSVHLQVLEFADQNPDGITLEELKAKFPSDFEWIEREMSHSNLFTHAKEDPWRGGKIYLTFEDRFRLLEHEELKSANSSSRTATYFATAALLVSIVSTSLSVYFFNKQQNAEIKLEEAQIQKLLTIKNLNTDDQLNTLIQKQIDTINSLNEIIQAYETSPNKALKQDK